jgi:hypothetical protein
MSLAGLKDDLLKLLDELQQWTPEQLDFRPTPESWSALMILDHMIKTERTVLSVMRTNLAKNYQVTLRQRFRSAVVLTIMALPIKVKVPKAVTFLVPAQEQLDLDSLCKQWEEDRIHLSEFICGLSSEDRKRGVFRHPVGGWTTPNGALLFLRAHIYHHRYQLGRLQKAWRNRKTQ